MDIRRWIMWRVWGGGRPVRYVFIHPTCGDAVEAGYLPEWGRPRFLCRRCGVAFDEAQARIEWRDDPRGPDGAAGRRVG